ncbi:DUF4365 domain-containing protein [Aeromonas hydrophila]|uniref:DUF4365 domain-containing protein n=1 Tax=Aeromonas hydrophila TaxID=644 RepID=UPI003EC8C057
MTSISQASHIGELGVSFLQLLCSKAHVIFRPVRMFDVGIDGIIEPQVGCIATGSLIGVQIKSGKSFRRTKDGNYSFISDKAHFEYWSRCTIPVIGVVYDPEKDIAVWVNLSDSATSAITSNGPWSIPLNTNNNTLNLDTLQNLISSAESTRINRRLDDSKISTSTYIESQGTNKISIDSKLGWEELFDIFLSLLHDDWDVADAGYRLSLYFPSKDTDPRRIFAINRLATTNELQLVKIVNAMAAAMRDDADPVADHICNMIRYVPNIVARLERMLSDGCFTDDTLWVAIQAIESIGETVRPDLWHSYNT